MGSHDCGPLFLDLFAETLRELGGTDHDGRSCEIELPEQRQNWRIQREASRRGFGQIDLLMQGAGVAVAIENKINAHDQERQVECYADYLKSTNCAFQRILYLTLHGHASSSAGTREYARISYSKHIMDWLHRCLDATCEKPSIQVVIKQYVKVVNHLIGYSLNQQSMQPVIEIIRSNPGIIQGRNEINKAVDALILEAWENIKKQLCEGLSHRFKISSNNDGFSDNRYGQPKRSALVLTPSYDSPLQSAPFEVWIERDMDGFGVGPVPRGYLHNRSKLDDGLIAALEPMLKNVTDEGLPTERFPLGWKNLLPGVADQDLAPYVNGTDCASMCQLVLNYVGALERAYQAWLEKRLVDCAEADALR